MNNLGVAFRQRLLLLKLLAQPKSKGMCNLRNDYSKLAYDFTAVARGEKSICECCRWADSCLMQKNFHGNCIKFYYRAPKED